MGEALQNALIRVESIKDLELLLPQTLEGTFGEGTNWRSIVGELLMATRHFAGKPTLEAIVDIADLKDHTGQSFSSEIIQDCLKKLIDAGFFEQSESPQGSRYRLNPDVKTVFEKIMDTPKK